MNQAYLSPSLLMSPPPPPRGHICPTVSPMQKEPPSPCRSRGRAVAAKAADYFIPRPPACRRQEHCAKGEGRKRPLPLARCSCSPPRRPSAPKGGSLICFTVCPPVARCLPAACPPLPRAAYGGLYQGRSAGYLIPRPPAWRRQPHCAKGEGRKRPLPLARASARRPAARPPPKGAPQF